MMGPMNREGYVLEGRLDRFFYGVYACMHEVEVREIVVVGRSVDQVV
jgi:hypothetical protein